ncbi:MAG: hypothetical protein AB1760_00065 [Pseudomonadota bacterium]
MRLEYHSPVSRVRRERLARIVWAVSAALSWLVAAALAGLATLANADGLHLAAGAGLVGSGMFALFGYVFTLRAAGR